MQQLDQKLARLSALLLSMERVIVGFSGGVDSSLLAAVAVRMLGHNALAMTAVSETLPAQELREAMELAAQIGIPYELLPVRELDLPEFCANTRQRCYFCKKHRFSLMCDYARQHNFAYVIEGSNADDVTDFRPGMKAVAELSLVRSPLLETGFTKQDIRRLAQDWGIPTWNKPSNSCLASRVAYHIEITPQKLNQVEQAEKIVRSCCPGQVRVRHHGDVARIEVEENQIAKISERGQWLTQQLRRLGFVYVALDLSGFRSGSMNEAGELL